MANKVEIEITADAGKAKAEMGKLQTSFGKATGAMSKHAKKVGAGMVVMGTGIEALARKQAPLTEATRKLTNATGMSEDAIRDMATSLSNATFPLDEALGLMAQGSKQGLESAEALKEYATFWDMVGDATGLSSEQLSKSAAALKSVGVSAGEEGELLGAFGLITRETSGNVGEFLKFVERLAPEMSDMGISVDDAAVAMAALEGKGITSRAAMSQFREAIADIESGMDRASKKILKSQEAIGKLDQALADGKITQAEYNEEVALNNKTIKGQNQLLEELSKGGLDPIMRQLGLTREETEKYRESLEGLGGVMADDAEAFGSTKTRMEELQSALSDVVFQNGALLEKMSGIAPIMMAAGPVIAGFGPAMKLSMGIATKALRLMRLAMMAAMGVPAGVILLAIAAVIAVGVLLWKNWDTIKEKALSIWGAITEFFKKTWEFIKAHFIDGMAAVLLIMFPPVGIAILVARHWGKIVDVAKDIWKRVTEVFRSSIDSIMRLIQKVMDAASKVGGAVGFVGGLIQGREHGGPVTAGQPVIVGERRPELFVPRTSGTILPRVAGAAGGSGMTINLVINGDINGMDDFEEKVTSVIRDAVLGGGFSGVLSRA